MTEEQSVLLKLIRQSQFDTVEYIAWDDIDLDALYEEASQQAVLGLIAPLIPEAYSNDTWRKAQLQQEASYIRYCFAQDELKKILDDNSIPFVILKGNASAIYYKTPMYRAMGDIDVLVNKGDYDRAKTILLSQGYNQIHKEDMRNIPLKKNGMTYELHKRFSANDKFIEDYITDGLHNAELQMIDGHSFPMLPQKTNGLVLIEHMRQHLMSGLGLRQLIDWMMYVHARLDNRYWYDEFQHIATEKGLETLAITATRTCQLYLGLQESITWCKEADDQICNELLGLFFSSGNFGNKHGKGVTIESVNTHVKKEGLFRWLQHTGEKNWKAYHYHHWLKPLCWLYQANRYTIKVLFYGRDIKRLKGDIERSNERYELLKKLNIN